MTTRGAPEIPAATTVLDKAHMIQARDVQLAPGQYRYVRTGQTIMNSTERCRYREINVDELRHRFSPMR